MKTIKVSEATHAALASIAAALEKQPGQIADALLAQMIPQGASGDKGAVPAFLTARQLAFMRKRYPHIPPAIMCASLVATAVESARKDGDYADAIEGEAEGLMAGEPVPA